MQGTHPGLARLSVAGCTPFVALVHEGRAQPLADWNACHGSRLLGSGDMVQLLRHWRANAFHLTGAVPDPGRSLELNRFHIHAPVQPGSVYCTIGNYRAQLLEAMLDADADQSAATQRARGVAHLDAIEARSRGEPYVVMKPAASVCGPQGVLDLHAGQDTLDWEVEIGAVIGMRARHVRVQDALAHVAGYCTVNDVTLRQRLFRPEPKGMGTDFLQAKGGPGWLPLGPLLVPAATLSDPQKLTMQLALNGRTMQEGRASDMLFGIAEQITYLSTHVELQPGDLVCTGSPAGFGSHHQRFLRAGDLVEAEVRGLGAQRTQVQAVS